MSHPDPCYDSDNSYNEDFDMDNDTNYDDYNDFYGENMDYEDYNDEVDNALS